jgi:glutathione S-transferase
MIELHQFPRGANFPNYSPFCAKLEGYLLLSGLPFESKVEFNPAKGPKGRLPFVVDEGETIADSAIIIDHLKRKHGDLIDAHLSPAQKATTVAYQVMLEEHLVQAMVYFRWKDDEGWELFSKKAFGALPKVLRMVVPRVARKGTVSDLEVKGMGQHQPEEVLAFARKEIEALSLLLGKEEFFFNGKPSLLDLVAYSVIGNILSDGAKRPLAKEARKHANLVEHSDRMQELIQRSTQKNS